MLSDVLVAYNAQFYAEIAKTKGPRQDLLSWGKDKPAAMRQRHGQLSPVSTVGRILAYLKRHGRRPSREARRLVQVDGG